MTRLQQKKRENKKLIISFIAQADRTLSVDLEEPIVIEKMQALLQSDTEEAALMEKFNQLLEHYVANLNNQLVSPKGHRDRLTDLPNRASYEENILSAYHRWQRGFGELSLAVTNIDHFKEINTNHGHLAADQLLKEVVVFFKSSVRAVDFIARYNATEFVFIFERTQVHQATMILENLRETIEALGLIIKMKRSVLLYLLV